MGVKRVVRVRLTVIGLNKVRNKVNGSHILRGGGKR